MKPKILQAGSDVYFTLIVLYNYFCVKSVCVTTPNHNFGVKCVCTIVYNNQGALIFTRV